MHQPTLEGFGRATVRSAAISELRDACEQASMRERLRFADGPVFTIETALEFVIDRAAYRVAQGKPDATLDHNVHVVYEVLARPSATQNDTAVGGCDCLKSKHPGDQKKCSAASGEA